MTFRSARLIGVLLLPLGCGAPERSQPVRLTVPRGASLSAVAESLAARDVIRSARMFRALATLSGNEREIQAGTYEFPPGVSLRRTLDMLTSGGEVLVGLTIPEGFMLREIAERVQQQLGIDPDTLLAAARDSSLREAHGIRSETLEGYLYPSTYYVRTGARATEVLRQMLDEFERQWQPEWNRDLDRFGMSRHEIVILASIIEGEVRYGPDRPYVSSVYHNRMRRGMRLQADPTVIYALGRRRRLYERDYRTPSPYNTYLIDGLPPGPIGQPSAASLYAALHPARTNYLFFVARPDGKHVFSRTLREHNAAVREVRRMEAELGLR